jgi:hypothetical protein
MGALLAVGCYAHVAAPTPSAPQPASRTHIYDLCYDGRHIGTERFEQRTCGSGTCIVGDLRQSKPEPIRIRYRLRWGSAGVERFRVQLRLLGLTRTTTGTVTPSGVVVRSFGVGGEAGRTIAHGPGTAVELGSPLSLWWAWSAVGGGAPALLRTLVIRAPALDVRVQTLRRSAADDGWAWEGPGNERTEASGVGDGFPRRWVTRRPDWDAPLIRRRRDASDGPSCAAEAPVSAPTPGSDQPS